MARTARCPACGAPVTFRSAASILAVCDFCQGTLVRSGEALQDLGRMAALIEDQSPIQRGSEGRWRGLQFTVVGRIQLSYPEGLWNEWHLLLDDGSPAWLSEGAGEYLFTRPDALPLEVPAFAELRIDTPIVLAGIPYRVTNLLNATCVAGEGELPFVVGPGYPAPVADLRTAERGFASLDYSDDPARPRLFVGQSLAFEDITWSNLRQFASIPEITAQAQAFPCPSCGAPLRVPDKDIVSVGCAACGTLIDTAHAGMRSIAQAKTRVDQVPRLLELGSAGTLRGRQVRVIGFMRRRMSVNGASCAWNEYLLLDTQRKPLWLVEDRGHWNLAQVLPQSLKPTGQTVLFEQQRFVQYSVYKAWVDFVIGEFPWRVALDEMVLVSDFLCVPRLLSRERSDAEVTWTVSEYLEGREVASAFRLAAALPATEGICANQPNPYLQTHDTVLEHFSMFVLAALLVHLGLMILHPERALLKTSMHFDAGSSEPQMTPVFELARPVTRLEVDQGTTVTNGWIELDLALINQDTSQSWHATREFSEYHGVEGGEAWREDARSHAVMFRHLPAGHYALAVDHDMDAGSPAVDVELLVQRPGPRWSMLVLAVLTLGTFPLLTLWLQRDFESQRRSESSLPVVDAKSDRKPDQEADD